MRILYLVLFAAVVCFWLGLPLTSQSQYPDPLVGDPKHYHLIFQNAFVQVLRGHYGPHEKGAMHTHKYGALTVFLTDEDLRTTTPDGQSRVVHRKAGEVQWYEPGTHQGENLSDHPYEFIRVDIKAAR